MSHCIISYLIISHHIVSCHHIIFLRIMSHLESSEAHLIWLHLTYLILLIYFPPFIYSLLLSTFIPMLSFFHLLSHIIIPNIIVCSTLFPPSFLPPCLTPSLLTFFFTCPVYLFIILLSFFNKYCSPYPFLFFFFLFLFLSHRILSLLSFLLNLTLFFFSHFPPFLFLLGWGPS